MLADSSVVTIALPEILARYDVEIATLSWALTSYNLALALAALPAAISWRVGVRLRAFGVGTSSSQPHRSSAPSRPRSRCSSRPAPPRGAAGAAVVCGALALLAGAAGGDAPAARVWALAGVIGAALGPAAGGVLTQLFG